MNPISGVGKGLKGALTAGLLLWSIALVGAGSSDSSSGFFDMTFGDFAEELKVARETGKQGVMLMFEMDACPFCQRMKATVLNQVEVQEFFKNHFLIFAVDIEGDLEIQDFQGRPMTQKDFGLESYRVSATPTFAFIDLDGNLMTRHTGALKSVTEFLWLGDYVVQGHYAETTFKQYMRERHAALR